MEGQKHLRSVSAAIGWTDSEVRERMQDYQNLRKDYLKSQNTMNCSEELSREEKDNLFKEGVFFDFRDRLRLFAPGSFYRPGNLYQYDGAAW